MESILKETLPKEVIEVQEALPALEAETGGLSWGHGIGIVVVVAVVAVLAKKVRCCKK